MGWATDIGSGDEFVKAVTGRVERIVVEAAHQGQGRGAEERSPPKKGSRSVTRASGRQCRGTLDGSGMTVPEIDGR